MLTAAPPVLDFHPRPDVREPPVHEHQGDLGGKGDKGGKEWELRGVGEEVAVEGDELVQSLGEAVSRGKEEAAPPEAGLKESVGGESINCGTSFVRWWFPSLNSPQESEAATEGREESPRMVHSA